MKWISVEESLPDFGVYVLVHYIPKHPAMGRTPPRVSNRVDLDRNWVKSIDENKFRCMGYVTHWMYLPQPPKEY